VRRRLAASGVAALLASGGLLALDLLPAHADGTSATVSPSRGAWYPSSPVCTLPLGCGSAPTTTAYPEGTLHAGATSGQEAARAYLGFSATALSSDVTVTSGQLIVPVDPDAGSNAPDLAALQLCVVPAGLANPAPAEAPAVDCTLSSPLTYLAGTPSTFVADLGVFLLRTGGRVNGLALAVVPVPPTATNTLTDTWHVAFSAAGRKGGSPVVADLRLAPAGAPPQGPVALPPPPGVPLAPVGLPPLQPPAALPPVAQAPVAIGPPPVQASVVPSSFVVKGHRFGVLWAMPLGLFLLGWAFASSGRRDLRSYARPVARG
jgi:hypothetical protein